MTHPRNDLLNKMIKKPNFFHAFFLSNHSFFQHAFLVEFESQKSVEAALSQYQSHSWTSSTIPVTCPFLWFSNNMTTSQKKRAKTAQEKIPDIFPNELPVSDVVKPNLDMEQLLEKIDRCEQAVCRKQDWNFENPAGIFQICLTELASRKLSRWDLPEKPARNFRDKWLAGGILPSLAVAPNEPFDSFERQKCGLRNR